MCLLYYFINDVIKTEDFYNMYNDPNSANYIKFLNKHKKIFETDVYKLYSNDVYLLKLINKNIFEIIPIYFINNVKILCKPVLCINNYYNKHGKHSIKLIENYFILCKPFSFSRDEYNYQNNNALYKLINKYGILSRHLTVLYTYYYDGNIYNKMKELNKLIIIYGKY